MVRGGTHIKVREENALRLVNLVVSCCVLLYHLLCPVVLCGAMRCYAVLCCCAGAVRASLAASLQPP